MEGFWDTRKSHLSPKIYRVIVNCRSFDSSPTQNYFLLNLFSFAYSYLFSLCLKDLSVIQLRTTRKKVNVQSPDESIQKNQMTHATE